MMNYIITAILALTVAGCSIGRTEVRTVVHPETQHHINENAIYFSQLVNKIRLNSNVKNPSPQLKNEMNHLAFMAGLIPQCADKYGCYLIRPGFTGRIRIDSEFITIDFIDRYMKIEDANEAINIIYS
jgi:hypothetical protein